MSKKPTITTITSGYGSTTQLNGNFSALRSAFDNTLSLDGSTPNAMSADLDLNSYDLLNVNTVNTTTLFIAGSRVISVDTVFTWKGAWVTGTSYTANNTVSNSGSSYLCLVDHTAGATFSADLSAGKWAVLAQQGSAGAGSGDLLAANNLSDLVDAPTALGNLGLSVTAAEINKLSGVTSAVVSVDNTQTLTNKTLTSPVLGGTPKETVYAISGTTPAITPSNGSVQTWTLSGNSTPTDSLSAGEAITLMIDDGAGYTITWPTMTWVNNAAAAPSLATTGYTVIALWKVSTTLYGALVGDGS